MTNNDTASKFIDDNARDIRKMIDSIIDEIDDFIIERIPAPLDLDDESALELRDLIDLKIRQQLLPATFANILESIATLESIPLDANDQIRKTIKNNFNR